MSRVGNNNFRVHRPYTPVRTTPVGIPPVKPTSSSSVSTLVRSSGGGGLSGGTREHVVPRKSFNSSRPATAPPPPPTRLQSPSSARGSLGRGDKTVKSPRGQRESSSAGSRTPRSTPRTRTRTLNVVLPPRRISSVSSAEDIAAFEGRCSHKDVHVVPAKIDSLHFEESYTPHKSFWVKKALENLGGDWVRKGEITNGQLVSEEFEEKMGVLYDIAMARKHDAIDRLVSEEVAGKRDGGAHRGKGKDKRVAGGGSAGGVSSGAVQRNFPFAEHLSIGVLKSMSEALLRIMMRDDMKKKPPRDDESGKKVGDGGVGTVKTEEVEGNNNNDSVESSNSFDRSLKKRKRSLVQCYVIDGKLVVGTKNKMLSVGGSFVNKFGDSSLSRARRGLPSDGILPYFRQTCNMMGFLPSDVTIRYCKNSRQLVVSGARPKRGRDNARQVRETIEVPKGVDIFSTGVTVLRTFRGSLIFEEVETQP